MMDWARDVLCGSMVRDRRWGGERSHTYFRRTSMTCGSSRSFDVAGSFSLFACSSSATAASMASRSRETSSSAYLSSTSSSSLRLRFCLEPFFGFMIASNCMSRRIFAATSPQTPISYQQPAPNHDPSRNTGSSKRRREWHTHRLQAGTGSNRPPRGPSSSTPASASSAAAPPRPPRPADSSSCASLWHASPARGSRRPSLRRTLRLRASPWCGAGRRRLSMSMLSSQFRG